MDGHATLQVRGKIMYYFTYLFIIMPSQATVLLLYSIWNHFVFGTIQKLTRWQDSNEFASLLISRKLQFYVTAQLF